MASNLLKTFEKIERGRQKCIAKANEANYPLPEDASLEQIANCIDSQGFASDYKESFKATLLKDFSNLPDGVFRFPNDMTETGEDVFLSSTLPETIIFPDEMTTISARAFRHATPPSGEFTIPSTVTELDTYCFDNFKGNLNIPSNVKKLNGMYHFDSIGINYTINYDGRVEEIPNSVFGTSNYSAFDRYGTLNMTDESIACIKSYSSGNFKCMTLNKWPIANDDVTIGTNGFFYCRVKAKAFWPASANSIDVDHSEFQEGLEIHNGPKQVESYGLSDVKIYQDELVFPASVVTLQARALQGTCKYIKDSKTETDRFTKIEFLGEGDLSLLEGCFVNSKTDNYIFHQTTFKFNSVNNQFNGQYCGNVVFLNMMEVPAIMANAFNATYLSNNSAYIYVPDDLYDEVIAATNWTKFSSRIKKLSTWPLYSEYENQLLPRDEVSE